MLKLPRNTLLFLVFFVVFLNGCDKPINEKDFVAEMKVSLREKAREFNRLADICGKESMYQRINFKRSYAITKDGTRVELTEQASLLAREYFFLAEALGAKVIRCGKSRMGDPTSQISVVSRGLSISGVDAGIYRISGQVGVKLRSEDGFFPIQGDCADPCWYVYYFN